MSSQADWSRLCKQEPSVGEGPYCQPFTFPESALEGKEGAFGTKYLPVTFKGSHEWKRIFIMQVTK